VCSSCLTTRNPNFQQLAKDKKSNLNQWEVHLIEFKLCEALGGLIPNLKKQKQSTACLWPTLTDKDIGNQASRDPRWSYGDYLQRLYR
jgi:hypothetical protein